MGAGGSWPLGESERLSRAVGRTSEELASQEGSSQQSLTDHKVGLSKL